MIFPATSIAMALTLSKFKSASAEGAETSSTSWEGEVGWNMFLDKNCTDPFFPNYTNSTTPISVVVSMKALGNNMVCMNQYQPHMNLIEKITIKCDATGLKGYEDYFLLSYNTCFDNNCRNCSDTFSDVTVEPKTNFPHYPYSCDPFSYVNLTTGELTSTAYQQFYASPEVMAGYMEPFETTCIGDYVKSSSSSSTPTDTVATTNETEGMLNDGSGAISGEEGGSSVASITWGVSSFVVLATAGLSTILFDI